MADKDRQYEPLTSSIVKGLNDKMYEKRKNAAVEIERYRCLFWIFLYFCILTTCRLVKQLSTSEDSTKIVALMGVLRKEFVFSTNPNSRKGGLIGLSATAIALCQVARMSVPYK